MTQKQDVDMVAMSIIDSTMTAVCREMGIVLMKTSYSTIFNEALDFTCALASPQGEMIAQAEYCPSMIGGVPLLVRSCVKEIPLDTLEPGDVICHNDPYRGGLHCPEHTLIKPVFVDDELMGFAMTIGHLQEIGGMVPGAFAGEATEIFHEGIRVPPVKIKSKGEDVEEVWKLLLANVRTPRYNYGDLRALIAGVDVGERGLAKLIRKYGKEQFRRNVLDLMDYSESRMRAEIGAIEDGVYRFQDQVEDDGIESKPYDIKVAVHIQGDEVVIDYSGTSPQALGPINATLGVSYSAAYNGILQVTDETIPKNSGCFRPIRVVSPPGTLLNVDYPGPEVGGNTETHCKIAGAVIGALSPGDSRPHHGGGGCDAHQLRLRRHRRGERRGVRLLRHRAFGLGRAQLRRRQRRHRFHQRQLPRRAGRGVRDPLPLPHRVLHPGAGFRRRRHEPRRAQHAAHAQEPEYRDHGQPDVRPPPQPALGAARRPARRARRHLASAGQHHVLAHDRRGLRQGQPQQVEQRPHPAGRFDPLPDSRRRRLGRSARAFARAGGRRPRRGLHLGRFGAGELRPRRRGRSGGVGAGSYARRRSATSGVELFEQGRAVGREVALDPPVFDGFEQFADLRPLRNAARQHVVAGDGERRRFPRRQP